MQIKLQEITGSVLFLGYFGLEFIRNYHLTAQHFFFNQFIFSEISLLQSPLKDEKKQRGKIINELVVC